MSGETNLEKLLASMTPEIASAEFIFCTFPDAGYGALAELKPIASCIEAEGLTLVISRAAADAHGISYESVFRCITLTIHSSLDAVGLTATIATALADLGICANVIAGYFHDRIFVPSDRAHDAMVALEQLAC